MFLNLFKKKIIDEPREKQKEDLHKESPSLYSLAINGKDCDSLIDSNNRLGHSIENPIPVNGVLGEIKYINRLRCECGAGLMYHRLGTSKNSKIEGNIDIYETVCMEGKHWDILCFHFYHPRRSLWCPAGYTFSKFHPIFSQHPLGYGTNRYDKNFPFGLGQFILLHLGEGLGRTFANKYEEIVKDENKFIRPKEHQKKISLFIPGTN